MPLAAGATSSKSGDGAAHARRGRKRPAPATPSPRRKVRRFPATGGRVYPLLRREQGDDTGGRLTTFEIDPGRAAAARKNFQQAGVDSLVTVVEGDAHQKITTLKGPIDVVFIDADKEGYVDYLTKLLPLVRPGGLILAHNVGMPGVTEYLKAAEANPDLETIVYREGAGLAVTVK